MKRITMKLAKGIAGLIVVISLLAAGSKGVSYRMGGTQDGMSTPGRSNTNRQWTADPKRGWLRADEHRELHGACGPAASKPTGSSYKTDNCIPKEPDPKDHHLQTKPDDLRGDY